MRGIRPEAGWRGYLLLGVTFWVGEATGAAAQSPPPGLTNPNPIWGYADLHAHQFSNLAYGGKFMWGRSTSSVPVSSVDQQASLPHCNDGHGASHVLDIFGIVQDQGFAAVGGATEFDGWPRWSSINHQTMYIDWLKRAYDGGLRLMVMHAVNNKLVCQQHYTGQEAGYGCEDMPAVDRQLAAAREFERFVDIQRGGPGKGWYRIVDTPQEARDAIAKDQLAVVLGIEVDELFGCTSTGNCNVDTVRRELKKYYQAGVRHVFPAHVFDNGFGGAALYNEMFNIGNHAITGEWFQTTDCSTKGYEFALGGSNLGFCAGVNAACAAIHAFSCLPPLVNPLCYVLIAAGATGKCISLASACTGVPVYRENASCNSRGLTPLGDSLIKLMMGGHMIIDIDHMSAATTEAALNLVEPKSYPVVAGHTGFVEISKGGKRAEGNKTKAVMDRLQRLGALVAPILAQGATNEIKPFKDPNFPFPPCSKSSWAWAQAYLYAVDAMKGAPVALGSDFNGFVQQPAPRYKNSISPNYSTGDACHPFEGESLFQPEISRLRYPFYLPGIKKPFFQSNICEHNPASCKRGSNNDGRLDYNVEGLAHVGLLPDFFADLQGKDPQGVVHGLTNEQLAPLFHSAEAYIELWERAEASRAYTPATDFILSPPPDAEGWNNSDVTVTLRALADREGWRIANLTYSASGVQAVPSTTVTNPSVALKISTEGVTMITFSVTDELGNRSPDTTITVRVNKTVVTPTATPVRTPSPTPPPTATPAPCGAVGQRACCAVLDGVRAACDSGLTEYPGCTGNCLCGGFNPFGIRSGSTCVSAPPTAVPGTCGEPGHRSCCVPFDGLFKCLAGARPVPGCAGECACGFLGLGRADSTCLPPAPCGGAGQRACCPGDLVDGTGCAGGLIQIAGCSGDCTCGGFNPDGVLQSTGQCVAPTATATPAVTPTPTPVPPSACGAAGQRACCVVTGEAPTWCASGLTEIGGCAGDCTCGGSNPNGFTTYLKCAQAVPCGGVSQRTCCAGEANTGAACGSGLVEAQGCTGDCLCGGPSNPENLSSSGHCITDTAEPTATPTHTAPIPAPTAEPVCVFPCAGDCNNDCQVTVNELVTMTNVALEAFQVIACIPGDANLDQEIVINEIVLGVNRALNGCPFAQQN